MRKLIIAIITFTSLLLGVGGVAPAKADHGFVMGYWNRAPLVGYDGDHVGNIQDAAYYWQDRGFDGYTPPLPAWNGNGSGCATFYDQWIVVCTVPRSTVHAYCGEPCDGHARTSRWSNNVIYGAFILISDDLSASRRQMVHRHEMGHALGMYHTGDTDCVMHEDAPVLGETCWHDYDTIVRIMYPGRKF